MPEYLRREDAIAGMQACLIPGCCNAGTHAPGGAERQ
jgi:hypothetical protein